MKRFLSRLLDHFLFTAYFVRGSGKAVLVSVIGLILALAVISENTMLLNSYRQDFFTEVDIGSNERGVLLGDIRLQVERSSPILINTWINTTIFREVTSQSLVEANYQNYVLRQCWYSSIDVFSLYYSNQTVGEISYDLAITIPDQRFFSPSLRLREGRWPRNYTEAIFVNYEGEDPAQRGPPWNDLYPSGPQVGQQLKIGLSPRTGFPVSHNVSLTIVGILDYQEFTWDDPNPLDLQTQMIYNYFREELTSGLVSNFIVTSPQLGTALVDELTPTNGSLKIKGAVVGKLFLDYTQIDGFAMNEEILNFHTFQSIAQDNFGQRGFILSFSDRFQQRLEDAKSIIFMYGALYYVLSVPMLGIALYLVIYSYGLIKKQRQKQVAIIKTRGSTSWQVLLGLLGETIVGILVALVSGLILGYLLTAIAVRSVDLLNFLGQGKEVIVSKQSIYDLVFWGIILAVGCHSIVIFRLARISILESEEPVEKRAPFWNRYYLDIWASVLGIAGLFLTFTIGSLNPKMSALIYESGWLLLIPAPFLMFIGVILLLSRFFPYLCQRIATILWKVSGGVAAFAVKNVVRHKYVANRTVIILTLVLTYAVFLGTFYRFFDSYNYQRVFFSMGADIRVTSPIRPFNDALDVQLSGLVGVHGVSAFIRTWASEVTNLDIGFLFVDPRTFQSAAYFNEYDFGLSASLQDLMRAIMDNDSIILYEENSRATPQHGIGGQVTLRRFDDNGTETISLSIVGTFRHWPQLYANPEDAEQSSYYWGVGSLGLFDALNETAFLETRYLVNGYLVSLDIDADPAEVVSQIDFPKDWYVHSPLLEYRVYLESFWRRFLLSVLNSNLVVGIIISIVSVTMFAFFTLIERNNEIGVERALGMTQRQLTLTFMVEGGLIMIFGVNIGVLMGLLYSIIVLRLFTLGIENIPIFLDFPFEFLGILALGVIVIAGLGSLVPAYLASKRDIGYTLKTE